MRGLDLVLARAVCSESPTSSWLGAQLSPRCTAEIIRDQIERDRQAALERGEKLEVRASAGHDGIAGPLPRFLQPRRVCAPGGVYWASAGGRLEGLADVGRQARGATQRCGVLSGSRSGGNGRRLC